MPYGVLDPGVPELDRRSPLPVLGITRLAAGLLASLGRPFAAVTRNEAIGREFAAVIARYGLAHFAGVRVLGLSVTDIAQRRGLERRGGRRGGGERPGRASPLSSMAARRWS